MGDELLRMLGDQQRRNAATDAEDEATGLLDEPSDSERAAIVAGAFETLDADTSTAPTDLDAHRSRARRWATVAAVAAVAAAVIVMIMVREPATADATTSPRYALSEFRAGRSRARAELVRPTDRLTTAPSDHFEAVLAPAAPNRGELAVALVARPDSGGPPRVSRPHEGLEFSADGAVRFSGPLDAFIELSEGDWDLELWIGAPSTLPVVGQPPPAPGSAVSVVTVQLEVVSTR